MLNSRNVCPFTCNIYFLNSTYSFFSINLKVTSFHISLAAGYIYIESFDLFFVSIYIESFDLFLSQYTCLLKVLTYFYLNIY